MAGFGADFKESLTQPGGWSFSMTAMGEMLPRYENHVRLNQTNKDQWGMPTLDIDCAWSDNEDKMTQDAITQAKAMMEAAGVTVIQAVDNHQAPGLAIHEMGTARMGRDPKTSIRFCDEWPARTRPPREPCSTSYIESGFYGRK